MPQILFSIGVGAAQCDIKVLILLYSNDKKAYLGFIPNDQAQFVERIRMVIQQQKSKQAMLSSQALGTLVDLLIARIITDAGTTKPATN